MSLLNNKLSKNMMLSARNGILLWSLASVISQLNTHYSLLKMLLFIVCQNLTVRIQCRRFYIHESYAMENPRWKWTGSFILTASFKKCILCFEICFHFEIIIYLLIFCPAVPLLNSLIYPSLLSFKFRVFLISITYIWCFHVNIYVYLFISLNVTYSVCIILFSCIFSRMTIWYWLK